MIMIAYSEKAHDYFFPFGKNKNKPFKYVKSTYLRWALEQCIRDENQYAVDRINYELNKRSGNTTTRTPSIPKSKTSFKSEAKRIETAMLHGVVNPQKIAYEMKKLKEQRKNSSNSDFEDCDPSIYDKDYDLVSTESFIYDPDEDITDD